MLPYRLDGVRFSFALLRRTVFGTSVIKSAAGIKTAASIQPVEFQHAAILSFVLGKYPAPTAPNAGGFLRR